MFSSLLSQIKHKKGPPPPPPAPPAPTVSVPPPAKPAKPAEPSPAAKQVLPAKQQLPAKPAPPRPAPSRTPIKHTPKPAANPVFKQAPAPSRQDKRLTFSQLMSQAKQKSKIIEAPAAAKAASTAPKHVPRRPLTSSSTGRVTSPGLTTSRVTSTGRITKPVAKQPSSRAIKPAKPLKLDHSKPTPPPPTYRPRNPAAASHAPSARKRSQSYYSDESDADSGDSDAEPKLDIFDLFEEEENAEREAILEDKREKMLEKKLQMQRKLAKKRSV